MPIQSRHLSASLSRKELETEFHSGRLSKHRLSRSVAGDKTTLSDGLTSEVAASLLVKFGRNELVEKITPRWLLLLKQFTGPMPIGIWIAIIALAALDDWIDAGLLLAMQLINGFIGDYERSKANGAIAALKASLKPWAQVKRDNQWVKIDAALLVPGDLVMLSAGSAVPADCIVHETVSIDQSAMTGESLPVRMDRGAQAKMGSTVARGEAEATVFATGMNTMYGKTAALLSAGSESLGDLDKLIVHLVFALLMLSVVLCTAMLIYLVADGKEFKDAVAFVVVLLVASIPIAIQVVVTATLGLGSRELSTHNAIVSKLSAIERLAGMDVLCSDKTGTLTLNKMVIQEDCPMFGAEDMTRDDVLLGAALATKWNEPAKDALDTMILSVADIVRCNTFSQTEYIPFDAELKRTESTVVDANGAQWTVMKGAPHAILDLCVNKEEIREAVEDAVLQRAGRGIRTLAVARATPDTDGVRMMGLLCFIDPPRHDAKETIALANTYGVHVKMITGDHQLVACETAKALALGNAHITPCVGDTLPVLDMSEGGTGIPSTLAADYGQLIMETDGFSQALPEHKFVIIEALKQQGHIVGMTGDGVNDAPALKSAHVGVAVQGATDAARAAADIVLTTPGLNAIIEAMLISRRIFARMHSFLVYRVAATIQILLFFFTAVILLHPEDFLQDVHEKFFSMPVIALIIITFLNDGTIIAIAYDNVKTSRKPRRWQLARLWSMSILLGVIAFVSSLIILLIALNSNHHDSLLRHIGVGPLSYGEIITAIYLSLSLSNFLTVFTARTEEASAFTKMPSMIMCVAAAFAMSVSTLIACLWPFGGAAMATGRPITVGTAVFVWAYCLLWFLLQDVCKVIVFAVHKHFTLQDSSESHESSMSSGLVKVVARD